MPSQPSITLSTRSWSTTSDTTHMDSHASYCYDRPLPPNGNLNRSDLDHQKAQIERSWTSLFQRQHYQWRQVLPTNTPPNPIPSSHSQKRPKLPSDLISGQPRSCTTLQQPLKPFHHPSIRFQSGSVFFKSH